MGAVATVTGAPATDPSVRRRLAEMGLRSGARITLGPRTAGGGRIIHVNGTRVALGRELVRTVTVAVHSPAGTPAAVGDGEQVAQASQVSQ